MHSMALSRLDDTGIVERQRSLCNRQCSVYASRIRPTVAPSLNAAPALTRMPTGLELLPGSLSPRWNSLLNGPHVLNRTPASPGAAAGDSSWSELPFPEFVASPVRSAFGHAQVAATDTADGALCTSPHLAASRAAAYRPDGRLSETVAVENFSRPRKQSIRQLQPAIPEQSAPEPAVPRLTTLVHTDLLAEIGSQTPQTPLWPSSPRPSGSSCKSASPFSSPLGPLPVELPDPKHLRVRNAAGASLTAARPAFAAAASPPMAGGGPPPPWVAADELRSSFRSQLTASSAFGITVTERSSVLTKDSSVTSLYANVDEPSLEDVMRMYEKGFADDDDYYDEDDYDHDHENTNQPDGFSATTAVSISATRTDDVPRPPTAMSAFTAQHADDINDAAPPVPAVRSTLDAEIRQSRMIFKSAAFTSSVPALCANAQLDMMEKRDSGKSLDSEPSVTSDPTTAADDVSAAKPTPMVPPPVGPLSPAAVVRAAMEPEDPGSCDRYGFKKQSQFITREQYDAWNKGYTHYLSRRHKKWVAYLRECSLITDRPIRFPPPNAKTKRFVRKGIPPDWRGAAWFYYAGGAAILAKHSGLYEKLLAREAKAVDVEAIERDLHRTFPDNIQFQPSPSMDGTSAADSPSEPPIISSLRRVLHAFALYNPRIGYCQSLNFLAGLLLLFVETEEQCFWLLNVITIIYLPGTHEMSLEGSKVDLGVLMTELRDTMPAVWDKIGGELEAGSVASNKAARKPRPMLRRRDLPHLSTERLPPITLCMTAWFMSCYIGTLPIETTLRVWDVFFYEGSKTLFRIALSIFKSGEAEIRAVEDPMEMFGVVQSLPRRMLDANGLMETCFKRRNGFGHLSQDVIDERRQERRDRARQDRAQQALHTGKTVVTSGNVTEAETEAVRRKGTLFGMKLRDGSRTRAAEV